MSHPPRPPVGDVLDGLVAIVEQETAKLGNRDAWRDANLPERLHRLHAADPHPVTRRLNRTSP